MGGHRAVSLDRVNRQPARLERAEDLDEPVHVKAVLGGLPVEWGERLLQVAGLLDQGQAARTGCYEMDLPVVELFPAGRVVHGCVDIDGCMFVPSDGTKDRVDPEFVDLGGYFVEIDFVHRHDQAWFRVGQAGRNDDLLHGARQKLAGP